MDIVITNDDRIAIAEVDYIIHHMNDMYLNKIPQKVRDCITVLKKKNVDIYVDPHKPLDKQGLREFTLHFLMILNLKYWCNDERRKDIMMMMEQNQRRYEEKVNDIFGQAESIKSSNDFETASSKPRQITTVGNDVSVSNNENVQRTTSNEVVKQEERTNVIEELQNEEQSIMTTSKENIFSKIINKIKEILIRK